MSESATQEDLLSRGEDDGLGGGYGANLSRVGADAGVGVAGGDEDGDGVACPAGGVVDGECGVGTSGGGGVVGRSALGLVEEADHHRVSAECLGCCAGVVGPADVDGVGGAGGAGRALDVKERTFGELHAVEVERDGLAGDDDSIGEVVADGGVGLGLGGGVVAVADFDKAEDRIDEVAHEREFLALCHLCRGLGVVDVVGHCTHDVAAFPE